LGARPRDRTDESSWFHRRASEDGMTTVHSPRKTRSQALSRPTTDGESTEPTLSEHVLLQTALDENRQLREERQQERFEAVEAILQQRGAAPIGTEDLHVRKFLAKSF